MTVEKYYPGRFGSYTFGVGNFVAYEGRRIALPERFAPDPEFLRHHREQIFEAA